MRESWRLPPGPAAGGGRYRARVRPSAANLGRRRAARQRRFEPYPEKGVHVGRAAENHRGPEHQTELPAVGVAEAETRQERQRRPRPALRQRRVGAEPAASFERQVGADLRRTLLIPQLGDDERRRLEAQRHRADESLGTADDRALVLDFPEPPRAPHATKQTPPPAP